MPTSLRRAVQAKTQMCGALCGNTTKSLAVLSTTSLYASTPRCSAWQYTSRSYSSSATQHSLSRCRHMRWSSNHHVRHSASRRSYSAPAQPDTSDGNKPRSPTSHGLGRARSRSVIVTGGTSGIGFAVAKQAVLEGASHVRIITRDASRGQAAIDKIHRDTNTDAVLDCVQAEADEYADPKIFHHETTSNDQQQPPPPFTTIIHCAGITQTSLLTSTQPETIKQIFSVNLESAALLSRSLLKRYLQTVTALHRKGSNTDTRTGTFSSASHLGSDQSYNIINISSLLAQKGGYGTSIYAASKAGLIALTRAIALEGAEVTKRYADVAPGFRANVVLPGYIETAMTKDFSASSKQKLVDAIPSARFGSAEEVADAVMFLLGNEYANNCVLNLDGGLSAT